MGYGWKKTNCVMIRLKVNIRCQHDLAIPTDKLSHTDVEFAGIVCNLGFIFGSDLSMKQYIIKTCKAAYIEYP